MVYDKSRIVLTILRNLYKMYTVMPESEPEVDQTLNDFATLLYTGFFIFRIQTLNPCLRILVCYHALSHPAINLRKFLYMLLNF